MGDGKKYLTVVILLTMAIVVFLAPAFGKRMLRKHYVSKDVNAEVLNWNPDNGELKVRVRKETTVLTTTIPVNPPETSTYVKVAGVNEEGSEIIEIVKLTGAKEGAWKHAFCVGDTVRLTSDGFDISSAKIGQTLDVSFIQKTNDTTCEQ